MLATRLLPRLGQITKSTMSERTSSPTRIISISGNLWGMCFAYFLFKLPDVLFQSLCQSGITRTHLAHFLKRFSGTLQLLFTRQCMFTHKPPRPVPHQKSTVRAAVILIPAALPLSRYDPPLRLYREAHE